MGSVRQAFNTMTRIHSRAAVLKRPATPDLFSPIRITPSNYFRFLEGPSSTVVHGREFIIPLDSIKGSWTQLITFSSVPTLGVWTLDYNGTPTSNLVFNATANAVQTALRLIAPLAGVTVTGDMTVGFTVVMLGLNDPFTLTALTGGGMSEEITIAETTPTAWTQTIRRGDKIIDATLGLLALDEIIEMYDVGGAIMGWRVRCE